MKHICTLLCGVLLVFLVGCSPIDSANRMPQDNMNQEIVQASDYSQEEIAEGDIPIEVNESKEEQVPISVNELGEVQIQTEGFVENMDKLFINLDDYEGKTLTYEGVLIQAGEANDKYAVVRLYDLAHGDHVHSISVGLETIYDGQWPEINSWVKVKGKIERANNGGEDYPVLKVEEMTVMPEQGQLTVLN